MKQIIGYENYSVDEYGTVYNREGRVLKPWHNNCHKRYLRVTLSKNNKSKHFFVHRLVAQHYLEDYDESLQVDHILDCFNNHFSNLQMKTNAENNSLASQREWEKGGNQLYSDNVVSQAIILSRSMSSDKVGKLLGISGRTVRRYKNGTSRKFVSSGEVQRLSYME